MGRVAAAGGRARGRGRGGIWHMRRGGRAAAEEARRGWLAQRLAVCELGVGSGGGGDGGAHNSARDWP